MRCLPKTGSYTLAYTSYQGQKLSQASITWCLYPSFGHFVDLESVKVLAILLTFFALLKRSLQTEKKVPFSRFKVLFGKVRNL